MSRAVTIIDYGVGNLLSVSRALEYCGAKVKFASAPVDVEKADRLVLPGVGAFEDGMEGLRGSGLDEAIKQYALTERPLMGICLGMQMLTSASEEFGEHEGLDIIPARVTPIPRVAVDGSSLKIPHTGWSALQCPDAVAWQGTILSHTKPGSFVYLVHSFAVDLQEPGYLLSNCNYGGNSITTVFRHNAVYGCQFHPEKSGRVGLDIIGAFLCL